MSFQKGEDPSIYFQINQKQKKNNEQQPQMDIKIDDIQIERLEESEMDAFSERQPQNFFWIFII